MQCEIVRKNRRRTTCGWTYIIITGTCIFYYKMLYLWMMLTIFIFQSAFAKTFKCSSAHVVCTTMWNRKNSINKTKAQNMYNNSQSSPYCIFETLAAFLCFEPSISTKFSSQRDLRGVVSRSWAISHRTSFFKYR